MSSPNKALMVRLENGRTGNPGLATVGRYLRACRAGFVDVLDVLEGYTRKAPVPEARAARAIAELESRLRGEVRIVQSPESRIQSPELRTKDEGRSKTRRRSEGDIHRLHRLHRLPEPGTKDERTMDELTEVRYGSE